MKAASKSIIREELRTIRLGIWSGLLFLALREVKSEASPILLLPVCVLLASFLELLHIAFQSLGGRLSRILSFRRGLAPFTTPLPGSVELEENHRHPDQ